MSSPLKITVREIETFVVLAGCERVREAAKKLRCGASDVTKQRKSLEEKLGGVRLFQQRGPAVHLTEEGRRYLKHAEAMHAASVAGLACFQKPFYAEPKHIRLAYVESPTALFLPEVIRRFKDAHPTVKIVEDTPWADGCVSRVKEGKVDIALTIQPEPPIEEPTYEELVRYRCFCAVFERHKLAQQASISLREMTSECLLMMGPDANQYNRHIRMIFKPVGGIREKERCANFRSQLTKVAANTGVAFVLFPMKRLIGDLPIRLKPIVPDTFIGVGALLPRQVIPVAKDFIDAARHVIHGQFKKFSGNAQPPN